MALSSRLKQITDSSFLDLTLTFHKEKQCVTYHRAFGILIHLRAELSKSFEENSRIGSRRRRYTFVTPVDTKKYCQEDLETADIILGVRRCIYGLCYGAKCSFTVPDP